MPSLGASSVEVLECRRALSSPGRRETSPSPRLPHPPALTRAFSSPLGRGISGTPQAVPSRDWRPLTASLFHAVEDCDFDGVKHVRTPLRELGSVHFWRLLSARRPLRDPSPSVPPYPPTPPLPPPTTPFVLPQLLRQGAQVNAVYVPPSIPGGDVPGAGDGAKREGKGRVAGLGRPRRYRVSACIVTYSLGRARRTPGCFVASVPEVPARHSAAGETAPCKRCPLREHRAHERSPRHRVAQGQGNDAAGDQIDGFN